MNSPETLLNLFADFIDQHHRNTLHRYSGYTGSTGALLLKVKGSDVRVLIRPWLRDRPVGLTDVLRSDERYSTFRGQKPQVHVHIAYEFRDNAHRNARRSKSSALLAYDKEAPSVSIVGSGNMPKELLEAFLSFLADLDILSTYDFAGTLVHKGYEDGIAQAEQVMSEHNPRAFLSYSWDTEQHRRWVLTLAADLIRNGVQVLIDEWDLRDFHDDLHLFMETAIRECDYVVLVCTPTYAARANQRKGGVGIESTIMTGEFYNATKAKKFIPITREAPSGPQPCLPSYLKTRYAIDFTDDNTYQTKLDELLRRLFERPRYRRPELGPIPELQSEEV